jgi:hypothetical protein
VWTVVYIAPNKSIALKLQDSLASEGIFADLRAANLDSDKGFVEILVAESEAEEAQEIITKVLVS